MSATGPAPRRRLLRRAKRPPPVRPDPADRSRARRRLVGAGIAVALALAALVVWVQQRPGPARPPREVQRIADGLRAAGHSIDRVARNSNGGWSVLFDDGEVQWFKATAKRGALLHPIRNMYEARRDPNVVVVDLHATVFAIVLSGRRQGSTLELGTAPTSAETIAAAVRTAVRAASPAR